MRFKSLDELIVVITGASSGIGLATAQAACARRAGLVLPPFSRRISLMLVQIRTSA